jgi:hypothetical protein
VGSVLVYTAVAAIMFGISLPSFTAGLDLATYDRIPEVFKSLDSRLDKFQLTSSYGLFRRMTGVGGRPEIVIGRRRISSMFVVLLKIISLTYWRFHLTNYSLIDAFDEIGFAVKHRKTVLSFLEQIPYPD